MARYSLYFGDCLSWMEKREEQSIHSIVTDPPYYDAIPYSDLMDFFYVWLRRVLKGHSPDVDNAFHDELAPKWDAARSDGELIDDASRFGGDRTTSKTVYEEGMFRAFQNGWNALASHGRMVVVFANKQPDAWEALVSAMVRAGFVVDGSWPIQTEMGNRTRALSSAALASSVWLVCKKRPETARPGWDNQVLSEMKSNIDQRLREFWDAGIHGPDFVWAATGPALEAYSKHPIVKKADTPGELMTVAEFLRAVRRIVVDFVVGRVLSETTHGEADPTAGAGLDDVTTYYLLHRYDFKMEDAPAGACILYAVSCNLSESELAGRHDILARSGGVSGETDAEDGTDEVDPEDDDAAVATEDDGEGTGSTFKLKGWKQRPTVGMGGGPGERPVPLIDQIHRLMHLWRAGDQTKVDQYLDDRRLRRSQLFQHVLQALIELAPEASEERSILEALMNHVRARGVAAPTTGAFDFPTQGSGVDDT